MNSPTSYRALTNEHHMLPTATVRMAADLGRFDLSGHLDTREAELKVDAYRALAEQDIAPIIGDLPDDLASVTDTITDLDQLSLAPSPTSGRML